MSRNFLDDVDFYLEANGMPGTAEELASKQPKMFVRYWLEWNGIVGFHTTLVSLFEELGWRNKDS